MAFHPVFHEIFDSLRFGRVLLVEISPGPPAGRTCRYCDVLSTSEPSSGRAMFSAPESATRVVLAQVEHGAAVDTVLFGGAGDPLRHRGCGSILRRLRTGAHVSTTVLTDGVLLGDAAVRRDASEADTVVVWLPAIEDRSDNGNAMARREAWERHVEGIASLRRESRVHIVLELPVKPGQNDTELSLQSWRRAAERIRPDRVFAVPAPGTNDDGMATTLERVRDAVHPKAGAFLDDGSPADARCFC